MVAPFFYNLMFFNMLEAATRLTDRELYTELMGLKERIERGEFRDPEEVRGLLESLVAQGGFRLKVCWSSGNTSVDLLVCDILQLLPLLHLGACVGQVRDAICTLEASKSFASFKAALRALRKLTRERGVAFDDLGFSEEGLAARDRAFVILEARKQYEGIMKNTSQKARASGMESLENFLKKNGLTLVDLELS